MKDNLIKIHNPNNLPVIDYRTVKPLQGNLKDLSESNYEKLKSVLVKRGFVVPLFVWWWKAECWIIDGHQRQRVMTKEAMNDNGSYEVPYIQIFADSRKEAKAQLLEISSQFGKITQEGFDEFTDELDNQDFEDVHFDALAFVGVDDADDDNEDEKQDDHSIVISFSGDNVKGDLENCLVEIQEVCERYDSAQIRVKE